MVTNAEMTPRFYGLQFGQGHRGPLKQCRLVDIVPFSSGVVHSYIRDVTVKHRCEASKGFHYS